MTGVLTRERRGDMERRAAPTPRSGLRASWAGSRCWSSNTRAHTSALRTALAQWALICARSIFIACGFLGCVYSSHLSLLRSQNQQKHLLCTYMTSEGCNRPAEARVPWFSREQSRQRTQVRGVEGTVPCRAGLCYPQWTHQSCRIALQGAL